MQNAHIVSDNYTVCVGQRGDIPRGRVHDTLHPGCPQSSRWNDTVGALPTLKTENILWRKRITA